MASKRPRAERIPNANNPRLLFRLVGLVASGIRRQRALAEVLDVELRTVHYYTQAGEWLGLLATEPELHLTDRGLQLAMAEPRRRRRLYAEAVWRNPFASDLMQGRSLLPEPDVIASHIKRWEPTMADATARRRASAITGLLGPALASGRPPQTASTQLQLAFAPVDRRKPRVVGNLVAGKEESPDVYALLLLGLLDNGELSTGQVRWLLDGASDESLPLAGYVEMAIRRGDAVRIDDRLVVTPGACSRPDLAADPVLIALTDPAYRDYIEVVRSGGRASAQVRRRFAAWDRRIFGSHLDAEVLESELGHVLTGRKLEGLPVRGDAQGDVAHDPRPFADCVGRSGLVVAFPNCLRDLPLGVGKLNSQLQTVRRAPASVRPPLVVDRRGRAHGTLFHPEEELVPSIPDNFSLRLRALTHVPAIACASALLLLDRRESSLQVIRETDRVTVRFAKEPRGSLRHALTAFVQSTGAVVARPPTGDLQSRELAHILEGMGIASFVGKRVILAEDLFLRLQEDAETRLVYEQLEPLVDRMHAWLDGL